MNHRHRDAPVSHGPECGGVVNAACRSGTATASGTLWRGGRGRTFCDDGGTRLITTAR